jgi:hypothetical protein
MLHLLLPILLVALVCSAVAVAAELVDVEVVSDTQTLIIEVKQGQSTSFDIYQYATGQLDSRISSSNPSFAYVMTQYNLSATGTVSGTSESSGTAFWAVSNKTSRPTQATADVVGATVSAAATTPVGDYSTRIVTRTTNPTLSPAAPVGQTLRDTTWDTVVFRVVPSNHAPSLTADSSSVTAEAGEAATNTGTFSDADGDTVSLTASVGTVSKLGNAWTWSNTTSVVGKYSVTITADDGKPGGVSQESFDVTVQDTTAPEISGVPDDVTLEATSAAGAPYSWTQPTASDIVDGAVSVTSDWDSGDTFPLDETTTVTFTATDVHGNSATASFDVTVQDTTAPEITVPSNITVFATSSSGALVTFTASASDLVDGSVPVTCVPPSGSTFGLGTTTVNCSATDAHGNIGHASFTVTVKYNFKGFFSPVDNIPCVNAAKAGSAIPVKFSLGGFMGYDIFALGYPRTMALDLSTFVVADDIETTVVAGGSSLNYDTTTGQYIYVWKTDKAWAGKGGRELQVQFRDGTTQVAYFKFAK